MGELKMEERYVLHTLLPVAAALLCLIEVVVRAFWPAAVLPRFDMIFLAAVSLLALVAESYIEKKLPRRRWGMTALTGGLTFGLLPVAAGLIPAESILPLAIVGAVTFLVLTALFTSLRQWMSTGPAGALAPLVAGVLLFLACQGFAGMFL